MELLNKSTTRVAISALLLGGLTACGGDDTKITVWEYPAGSVDENGNLKI